MGGEPVLPILLWRGSVPPRGARRSFAVDPLASGWARSTSPRCCRKAFRWQRPGAIEIKDLEQVAVDTTAQEKAITHPSDARLTHRAIEKLVELVACEQRLSS